MREKERESKREVKRERKERYREREKEREKIKEKEGERDIENAHFTVITQILAGNFFTIQVLGKIMDPCSLHFIHNIFYTVYVHCTIYTLCKNNIHTLYKTIHVD